MYARKDVSLGPIPTMSAMAFISGFVDTLSFVGVFGLFASQCATAGSATTAPTMSPRRGTPRRSATLPTMTPPPLWCTP